jgi:hypothetical protein
MLKFDNTYCQSSQIVADYPRNFVDIATLYNFATSKGQINNNQAE